MEIKEILWYIIISVVCIAPIIMLVRSASQKSRQVTKSLKKHFGRLPKEYDIWSGRGIALDATATQLVYVSCDGGKEEKVLVGLAGIRKCIVKINRKPVPENKQTIDPKDVLLIELSISGSGPEDEDLVFFQVDTDGPFQSNYYFQLARKWSKRLNKGIADPGRAQN